MPSTMRGAIAWLSVVAVFATGAAAQQPSGPLVGTVVDSADRPIGGALVFVGDGSEWWTRTGEDGSFRLEGLAAGTHRLSFRKSGFAPRSFGYTLDGPEDRDVGMVALRSGPDPTATVTGTVTGEDGRPLAGAEVELNGEVRALTDDSGRFRLQDSPVAWGANELLVRHLAHADAMEDFWFADAGQTVSWDFVLRPSPVEIAGVVAEGARTPRPDLLIPGFDDRRVSTNGFFLDRSEIEAKDPADLEDVLRTVPGLRARAHPFGTEYRFTRRTRSLSPPDSITFRPEDRCMSPVVYVDGVRVGASRREYLEIESLASVDDVVGIEVYNGASRVPAEFNAMGSGCGVIAIWTDQTLVPSGTLDGRTRSRTARRIRSSDTGLDLRRSVIIGSVVTGVALLFLEAVCSMPHFCR